MTSVSQDALQIATQTRENSARASRLEAPLFLLVYWLNSVAVSLAPALFGGLEAGRIGLTAPFTLILLCQTLIERADAAAPPPRALTLGFALLTLAPSSLLATLGLSGYALALALRSQAQARLAAACAVGLALTTLWSGLGRNLFAAPLLALDAVAVEALLLWGGEAVTRSGNIIRLENGHAIIIFADCATAFLLFPALVLSAALGLREATRLSARFIAAMGALVLALIAANLLRLCLLASSADAYAIGHGPIGQNLFDALLIGLAAGAALIGRDKPIATSSEPANRGRSGRWLAILLLIALIGLGLKLIRYGAPPANGDDASRAVLIDFLERHDWRFLEDQTLVQSTGYGVMVFSQEGCRENFYVSLLSAEGESIDAVRAALPDAAFRYGATLLAEPSRAAAAALWLDGAFSAIGLRAGFPTPALALAPPPTDAAGACLPPPSAAWTGLRRR